MTELDGRHYFHSLKTKGYLREVRTGSSISYDLAPRGVAYGRMAREEPDYIERYGNDKVFYRDLSKY